MGLELAEVVGHLSLLQRFPVEPLSGESLNTALLSSNGLVGDRVFELRSAADQPLTASGSAEVRRYAARYLEDLVAGELERWGRVRTPDGREYEIGDKDWLEALSRAVGQTLRVARDPLERKPLRLISRPTLRMAERAYGAPIEPARLRANLVVEIEEGKAFEENQWIGRRVRIGEAFLEVGSTGGGSVEANVAMERAAGDSGLLEGLLRVHGGQLGVGARVIGGQRLRTGDPAVLLD